jgi:hypothetical protein
MGTVVGTLFFQASDNPSSVVAVLFMSMFYTIVGAMTTVIKQFPNRSIYYKQQDANFFPTWTFVAGRSVATLPNACIDALVNGTMIYFLVGLAYHDGATIVAYFRFLLILFSMSFTSGLYFSMFSSSVRTVTVAQACLAITAILFVLFSGFTVQPDVIPNYYIWVYWVNFVAWALRSLVVNEFSSGKYDSIVQSTGLTEADVYLARFGFTLNDEPFTLEWVWWGILFTVGTAFLSMIASSYCLRSLRFATGRSLVTDQGDKVVEELSEEEMIDIPFPRVDLTFKNMHYTVSSSISSETLELLKGVDGVVEAGRMTALMGSSGNFHALLLPISSSTCFSCDSIVETTGRCG